MPLSKSSLVICHNAVGSIQAKDSAQAGALAQCLGELEEEIKKVDRGANVVVMEPKKNEAAGGEAAARRRLKKSAKTAKLTGPTPAEGTPAEV